MSAVLPRVKSKRPASLLSPIVAQLSAAFEQQPIVEAVPDEEASAVFILESVEKLLQAVSTIVDHETLQIVCVTVLLVQSILTPLYTAPATSTSSGPGGCIFTAPVSATAIRPLHWFAKPYSLQAARRAAEVFGKEHQ